jgi:hypothetical protein
MPLWGGGEAAIVKYGRRVCGSKEVQMPGIGVYATKLRDQEKRIKMQISQKPRNNRKDAYGQSIDS